MGVFYQKECEMKAKYIVAKTPKESMDDFVENQIRQMEDERKNTKQIKLRKNSFDIFSPFIPLIHYYKKHGIDPNI